MRRPGNVVQGRYALDHVIGSGGMGTVWLAHHRLLHRAVAVKFPHSRGAREAERFRNEALVAARVRGPNVVDVIDCGEDEGESFIVMELLEGESLDARLSRVQRIEALELAGLLIQAAQALDAAHALDVVHRDIKPSNLFLTATKSEPIVKVLDFGIAKRVEANVQPPQVQEAGWDR